MFGRIAPRYDLLNRLLSFGQDVRWRRRLAALAGDSPGQEVLDLATGTGDVILALLRRNPNLRLGVGLDTAPEMLALGAQKLPGERSRLPVALVQADATSLPFADDAFDTITMAFGIRNVVNVPVALSEMRRVLKPAGQALILEFSLPCNHLVRWFYLLYFRRVLPVVGALISGDRVAYRYLNRTVETFPYGQDFCEMVKEAGFAKVNVTFLTFGVAAIYRGEKPLDDRRSAGDGTREAAPGKEDA
jgi:demethylmenaquinone methyltransferase/2-methoxy-6-polyprenyl-1,4-benzoquinol methylase